MHRLKSYSNDVVNKCHEHYNKQKVLLEEFWLRYGGLLKYVEDFDAYMSLSAAREQAVLSFYTLPLYPVKSMGATLRAHDEILEQAKADLAHIQNVLGGYIKDDPIQEIPEEEETEEGQEGDPNFFPDIERQAITIFKEASDMGAWGFELKEPIFNLLESSVSWDGEKIALEYSALTASGKLEYDTSSGSLYTHLLYGVSLTGESEWFTDRQVVKNALKKIKIPGTIAEDLGSIDMSYKDMEGIYIVKNKANVITDVGKVYVRERGGSVFDIGRGKKITVNKSLVNGVAIKSETTKYKFIFGTFEH